MIVLAVAALTAANPSGPLPKAISIEPSADTIPATTIRFYVTFDRPARGLVRQQDALLRDATGFPLPSPFMDFGQELWSADGRRLTLLIDPGRVKRDVEGVGSDAAPLRTGERYDLAFGQLHRHFFVGSAVRRPLLPAAWTVSEPTTAHGDVAVRFERVMDAALLSDQVIVITADGRRVAGRGSSSPDDMIWRFKPQRAWKSGGYRIAFGPALEDISGNRVGEALDHDVGSAAVVAAASVAFDYDPSHSTAEIRSAPVGDALILGRGTTDGPVGSSPVVATSSEARCAPHLYRFEEDCSGLAATVSSLHGLDRLRYIPLGSSDSAWLTIGGEFRVRSETLDAPNFGIQPTGERYSSQAFRILVDADLRTTAGWRVFVQLSGGDERGRRPVERTFDRSAPDLQQGFVELPIPIQGTETFLRLGRQELDFGGNKLVSVRDPANLRLAFDMALLKSKSRDFELTAFWGRPVLNHTGAFDDGSTPAETFYGVTLRTHPVLAGRPLTVDLFALGHDRDHVVYADSVGRERRAMVTGRVAGGAGAIDYVLDGTYQFGRSASSSISAYGFSGEIGYSFATAPWSPRFGVNAGLASGDRRRGDGQLNSFDPLYPNLGYFTDAPIDIPINWQGFEPSLTLSPRADVTVKLGSDVRYRNSKGDSLYATSGFPLIGPTQAGTAFVDALTFAHVTWRATRHIQIDAGYVHGSAGKVLAASGGQDLDFGLLQAAFRF